MSVVTCVRSPFCAPRSPSRWRCVSCGPQAAARGQRISRLPILAPPAAVASVDSVGMTVSDMTRALDFYTRVLPFTKEFDVEVAGRPWEQLHGVFGARMRIVGLRLGDERLELTEYLAPKGRPMPADSRGNDRWFQHVAIIVRDMDRAYARLREHGVVHASTGPQRLPDWNPGAGGIQAFYFRDPDGHFLEILSFPTGKGRAEMAAAAGGRTRTSSASITPRSWSATRTPRWPSIATRSGCASRARARTTASSRST